MGDVLLGDGSNRIDGTVKNSESSGGGGGGSSADGSNRGGYGDGGDSGGINSFADSLIRRWLDDCFCLVAGGNHKEAVRGSGSCWQWLQ